MEADGGARFEEGLTQPRLADLERRVGALEQGLTLNTSVTNSVKKDTAELLTLFHASKLGVAFIKWFATVGVPIATLFAALKGWIKTS